MRYRRYGDELLLLELAGATSAQTTLTPGVSGKSSGKTISELLGEAGPALTDRFQTLKAFLLALGDDFQMKTLKYYFAFKRIKNFACVEVHPQKNTLLVYVKVDPDKIVLEKGFIRDVRKIGHFGTGDLEIRIRTDEDLERAKDLLVQSYEMS